VRNAEYEVYVGERQGRYDEKLVQILQSACGIFAEKGYHRASVRDVAAATGVSPAGLYYYFRSKEELLFLILDHSQRELLTRARRASEGIQDPRLRLQEIIRAHLLFFSENREEMRVLAREWEVLGGGFGKRILRLQREYAATVLRTLREIRPDSPRRELRASAMALFGMLTWTYQWHEPERDLSPHDLARNYTRIFLQGFAADPKTGEGREALPPNHGPRAEGKGLKPSVLSGPAF
jgi:AcrR family transcriptional regulator